MLNLKGVGVALVTPFNEEKEINFSEFEKVVNHVIEGGVDYVVVLGTTGEVAEDVVRDDARHSGDVARLLVFAQGGGGAGMFELLEDERVVGRGSVEGDLHPCEFPPASPLLIGVADDEEGWHDDLEIIELPFRRFCTSGELGLHGFGEVGAGVEGMDVDAISVLTGKAQHPGVDCSDVDRWVGCADRAG